MLEIKPYTIGDEWTASLQEWGKAYGHLIKANPVWLAGLPCYEAMRRADAERRARFDRAMTHQSLPPIRTPARPSWLGHIIPPRRDLKRELYSLSLAKLEAA